MASVHTLTAGGPPGQETYNAVAHFAMPTGSNLIGVPWKTCYVASFQGRPITSQLKVVGNGAGQITQQELNQITSGDIIELPFTFGFDPGLTDAEKMTVIDGYAARSIDEFKSGFTQTFRYYGLTRP